MNITIKEQILKELDSLPYDFQRKVLDFTQALTLSVPKGVPGKQLLHFAGSIPEDDLQIMAAAIETECESVDLNDW